MSAQKILSQIDGLISELRAISVQQKQRQMFNPQEPIEIDLSSQKARTQAPPMNMPSRGQKRDQSQVVTIFEEAQEAKRSRSELNSAFNLKREANMKFSSMITNALKSVYGPENVNVDTEVVLNKITTPRRGQCHLTLNMYTLAKMVKTGGRFIPKEVGDAIVASLEGKYPNEFFSNIESVYPDSKKEPNPFGPSYLNLTLNTTFLAQILDKILEHGNSFVGPQEKRADEKETVMVEYSQPNTHKAFHVGHMRNCAVGDCIARLYKHIGHKVIPVNYFGDEGAHVAKCLWLLKKRVAEGADLDAVPVEKRGEWLGQIYSDASGMVTLDYFTDFPYKSVVTAEVVDIQPHPAKENWNVVLINYGGEPATVVCGGTDYEVGDIVAYTPVGGIYKDKVAEPKMMAGVLSNGVIMGALELGIDLNRTKREDLVVREMTIPKQPEEPESQGGKKKKKKRKQKVVIKDMRILIFRPSTPIGFSLIEYGRLPVGEQPKGGEVADGEDLLNCIKQRKSEIQHVLHLLESGDAEWCALWDKTKQWSLDAFKEIYRWLDCNFDHDFTESECSELSQDIVDRFLEKGVFVESQGCVGCPLPSSLNNFCMLRKSNGTGLYATKDIALAEIKFNKFAVDRSFYVVDDSQSLHFKQVFATLKKMGFAQAEKCIHIPYALVTVPDGKMSSRAGNVILFDDLRNQLTDALNKEFIEEMEASEQEKEAIRHACSVASIRYGMLNHDVAKQIVFDLEKWTTLRGGDTGPYLMMQYARIRSIQRKVQADPTAVADFSLLNDSQCQEIMLQFSEFQNVISRVAGEESERGIPNPSALCTYLFDLCRTFSSWYGANNIKRCPDKNMQAAQLQFCEAFATVLSRGLFLLGIPVLERM